MLGGNSLDVEQRGVVPNIAKLRRDVEAPTRRKIEEGQHVGTVLAKVADMQRDKEVRL
jgi:hypothetical protein